MELVVLILLGFAALVAARRWAGAGTAQEIVRRMIEDDQRARTATDELRREADEAIERMRAAGRGEEPPGTQISDQVEDRPGPGGGLLLVLVVGLLVAAVVGVVAESGEESKPSAEQMVPDETATQPDPEAVAAQQEAEAAALAQQQAEAQQLAAEQAAAAQVAQEEAEWEERRVSLEDHLWDEYRAWHEVVFPSYCSDMRDAELDGFRRAINAMREELRYAQTERDDKIFEQVEGELERVEAERERLLADPTSHQAICPSAEYVMRWAW